MSSLGISLILLVALAIATALVYNLRQAWPRLRWPLARRDRPAAAEAPPNRPPGAPRGEPRLATSGSGAERPAPASDAVAALSDRDPAVAGEAFAPRLGDDVDGAKASEGAPVVEPLARAATGDVSGSGEGAKPNAGEQGAAPAAAIQLLSAAWDCIVEIPLPAVASGDRLLGLTQRFRRAGAKPVAVEGLAADAATDQWGALAAGRQYRALRIGILMANRHGPLNAMEFSEFVAGVQAIAEPLAALADTPDMASVLARARELDATCAQLDAQIGVNVEAPDPLGPAELEALAATLSVVERGSNRYARLGTQGEVVFSVALADLPNRLTFLLDVPRTSPASNAWSLMVEAAGVCAQKIGGRLVDDGGRPIAEPSLAQIARQLAQRYASLEAIGLPAGSMLALRVFN